MKQVIQTICVLTLIAGFIFGGPRPKLKSEIQMTKMKRSEPDYRKSSDESRTTCPIIAPGGAILAGATNEAPTFSGDGFSTTLSVIDSSTNGYGMWATVTRPMNVMSDGNMLVVYRQYAGENTTHGQLGAGYGIEPTTEGDPISWNVQYNVNYNGNPPWGGGGVGGCGCAQARYPSSLASEDYPYAIYNEYTGGPPTCPAWPTECSDYGGRPYFSYDEFGWGGESWLYPVDLDPLYDCSKDLWQGSVGYGFDNTSGDHHVSVVYDDWTRQGSYLFTSEAVEDGYIILGTETLIVNPQHQGTADYSSAAILSMNDDGQGILGVDGIFAGAEPDAGACGSVCGPPASNLTCNKVPMFKLTDNYGQSWAGNHAAFDFYYVPDAVFENGNNGIFDSWPNTVVIDACTGQSEDVCGYWSWYEFDMRVDAAGNPHIVISLLAETLNSFPIIQGKTGFYHLTIDRNMLSNNHDDNPQWVNTPQGWNWSYVPLPANDSFDWSRPGGTGYLFGAMAQISLSRDNPDIVYVVGNVGTKGVMSSEYDANGDGVEDDFCDYQDWPWQLYPEWSEDVWVAKSMDNGATWTGLENVTQTPRNVDGIHGEDVQHCSPEEQLVHTAHWSDDERVYYQFHQPNWGFNEIGEPLGADHMNRVFLGYSYVQETGSGGCYDFPEACNYDGGSAYDDGSCANTYNGTVTCPDGVSSGCDCNGDCYDATAQLSPLLVTDCNGSCGGGAVQACNTTSGGMGDCLAADDACLEGFADGCDYSDGDPESDVPVDPNCTDSCDTYGLEPEGDVNIWTSCDAEQCGANDPLMAMAAGDCNVTISNMAGFPTCNEGRCYTCEDHPELVGYAACAAGGYNFEPATVNDCGDSSSWGICSNPDYITVSDCQAAGETYTVCLDEVTGCTYDEYVNPGGVPGSCDGGATCNGIWIPFTWEGQVTNFEECAANENDCGTDSDGVPYPQPGDGNAEECKCSASGAESSCHSTCILGDLNGDGGWNVLDIVNLANCVLADDCSAAADGGCAGDMNGDGGWNVLDIVNLANCVLADSCGGRVDDASESRLIMQDNMVSIEADGFIGGVQMTLQHGDDFAIEMTDRALFADYRTSGNETRLLVITPETDVLFSYSGDFEISEIIVANSHAEVSASLPMAASFSLSEAYPNPFNPVTTMELTMPVAGEMKVEVYNLLGQSVSTLTSGYKDAGTYSLIWDASDAASGMYFVKAQADGFTKIQKLMLVK